MFVTPTSQNKAVQMQIGLGTGPILGLGNAAAALFGGLNGSYAFTALAQPIISAGTSGRFDIQNGAFCNGNNCTAASNLAVGALWIQIDAPDLETLERAGTQLVYIYSNPTAAGNNTAAVAVPPVFSDVAIDRWMTSFSETPLENRVNNINANTMSFAVTNFSDVAQSVTITLYDQYSHVIATKATPVLPAGTRVGAQVKPGGVYGDSFVNFFALRGSSLTDSDAAGDAQRTGTIDGSIVFQGSERQPIAPLVVRGSGRSTAVLLVTPAP